MSLFQKIPVLIEREGFLKGNIINYLKNTYNLTWNYTKDELVHHTFTGNVSKFKLNRLIKYCKQNYLKFSINNDFGKRSSDYRKEFYKHFKANRFGYYLCAYCGRPVKGKTLQIDHIYPVAKVNQSYALQKKLKHMGAASVNSYQNLAPACKSCNSFKRAKLGLWIPLGFFGRNYTRRLCLNGIILFVIIFIISKELPTLIGEITTLMEYMC
jgi:5-methylcytosine-specific restriction endonuclease McrA